MQRCLLFCSIQSYILSNSYRTRILITIKMQNSLITQKPQVKTNQTSTLFSSSSFVAAPALGCQQQLSKGSCGYLSHLFVFLSVDCLSSRTMHFVDLLVWLLSFIGMHLRISQVARLCLILFNSEVHSIVMNVSLFARPFTSWRVFGFMAVFLSSLNFFFLQYIHE